MSLLRSIKIIPNKANLDFEEENGSSVCFACPWYEWGECYWRLIASDLLSLITLQAILWKYNKNGVHLISVSLLKSSKLGQESLSFRSIFWVVFYGNYIISPNGSFSGSAKSMMGKKKKRWILLARRLLQKRNNYSLSILKGYFHWVFSHLFIQ